MTSFYPNRLQEVLRDSLLSMRTIVPTPLLYVLVVLNSLEDMLTYLALDAVGPVALV
jgi:hypothetical protein